MAIAAPSMVFVPFFPGFAYDFAGWFQAEKAEGALV